jgi:transposase InsO family protein
LFIQVIPEDWRCESAPPLNSDGIGWEYVHLAIDDHSRVAFGSIEPDERGTSACRALLQAIRYYRGLGVCFERVLGSTPITRTLQGSLIMGQEECHVTAKIVQRRVQA